MAECIHGFEDGLCDLCFPRRAPEPEPAVAGALARPPRATTRPTSTRASRPSARAAAGTAPSRVPPFASRRLYHVTHVRNLESILLDGELRPVSAGFEPDVDVVAPLVRELRARADVGDGRHVTDFVPFALSPDADRWAELRKGGRQAHWTAEAAQSAAADFVILVAVGKDLDGDIVVADGDAAAPLTRFIEGDVARAVAQVAKHDPELTAAEVLVPGPVPFAAVSLIAVAHEPARSRVRSMFADVEGTPPKVVVHPPWFAPIS